MGCVLPMFRERESLSGAKLPLAVLSTPIGGPQRRLISAARGQPDQRRTVHFGEEVVALVVHHDERREVLHLDLPDRLHAQFRVLEQLDAGDAVLRQPGSRATDRAEVEATVRSAGVRHSLRAVPLRQHDHRATGSLELVDVGVHPSGGRRSERTGRHPLGRLRRPGVVHRVVLQVLRHRLARVQALLDLGVRDVASDDHRAVQRKPGLHRVLAELGEDLRHRPAEVDLDDVAALVEVLVGGLGQEVRGLALQLLDEHALGGDLAQALPVGGARHRHRDRTTLPPVRAESFRNAGAFARRPGFGRRRCNE